MVNAYYETDLNLLTIYTAIIQPPYFDVNQPDYINYGITGSTLGHELTHAFDNDGRQYNAFGEYKDWVSIYINLKFFNNGCFKELNFFFLNY